MRDGQRLEFETLSEAPDNLSQDKQAAECQRTRRSTRLQHQPMIERNLKIDHETLTSFETGKFTAMMYSRMEPRQDAQDAET